MQLFDAKGTPVDVPDDKVSAALASGHLGLPAGAKIPVVGPDGNVGQVAVENWSKIPEGTRVASAEEFHQAQNEAQYGGIGGGIVAGLEGGARGASLGLTDIAAKAVGGIVGGHEGAEAVRKHLAGYQEANPIAATAGEIAGAVAPALLSGGSTAAESGAGLLARGAETAGSLGRAISLPSKAVFGLGELVEKGAIKALGGEAESLAGRLALKGAAMGARGGVEGAILGGTQAVDESVLGDTELNGQKLLAAMGHGALLGLGGGAVLGAGGELGREVLGKLSPKLAEIAEHNAVRTLDPKARGIRAADGLEEGAEGLGRRLLDEKMVRAGDKITDIAPRVAEARAAAGERVGAALEAADAAGYAGPRVANIFKTLENTAVKDLSVLPSINKGAISELRGLADDIAAAAGIPTREAAEQQGLKRAEMLEDARMGFKQTQDIRRRLDDKIDFNTDPFSKKPNATARAYMAIRTALEDEIERAGDAASKKLGGKWLEEYQAAKLQFADYNVADKIARKGLESLNSRRILSPSDYGTGAAFGIAGSLAHGAISPATAALGLAGAVGHHVIRERGNSVAAVMADKLSAWAAIERATKAVDREIDRGAQAIVGKSSRVPPRLKEPVSGGYAAKREAVIQAASQADTHVSDIAKAAEPIAAHAPNTANAFQRAAIRATAYLTNALPKHPAAQSLTPQHDKYEPSDSEKQEFEAKFDAIHDPVSLMTRVQQGTLTPAEVAAVGAAKPDVLRQMQDQLRTELAKATAPLPQERLLAATMFLGQPADEIHAPTFGAAMQQLYASQDNAQIPPQGASPHGHHGASVGAPKRQINVAKNTGLNRGHY